MSEKEPESTTDMDTPEPQVITNGEHKELWDAIWKGRVQLAQVSTEVRIGVGLAAAILGAVIFQLLGG